MIISSISYKGGVGKSTIAQNLAVTLANAGNKVCIVDADNANATVKWSGVRMESEKKPVIQVISMTDEKAIIGTVKALYDDYDYIIIDSPPTSTPISTKIILVSHLVLMPIKPTGGSEIWLAKDFLDRIHNLQEMKDEKIPAFFIVNSYDTKPKFHKDFVEALQDLSEEYEVSIFDTKIHHRIAYGEVNTLGLGVVEYSNKKAKSEFEILTGEIVGQLQ